MRAIRDKDRKFHQSPGGAALMAINTLRAAVGFIEREGFHD